MKGYIDLYLLPLPKDNLEAYRKIATEFGKIAREHGALDYREFVGDDLFIKDIASFTQAVNSETDELVICAVVNFNSREHRDEVMKKIFDDHRLKDMMKDDQLFDMKKMFYGGFSPIVQE